MGVKDSPAATTAAAKLARLGDEKKHVDQLVRLTAAANAINFQSSARVLGEWTRMGLQRKCAEETAAATARSDMFKAGAGFAVKVDVSLRGGDMGAMEQCVAAGEAVGFNTAMVRRRRKS